jgi:hypothetical protein
MARVPQRLIGSRARGTARHGSVNARHRGR